jgi:hypothetical protein
MVRKEPSNGKSLASLAGAGQQDYWMGPRRSQQVGLNVARYPHLLNVRIFCTLFPLLDSGTKMNDP